MKSIIIFSHGFGVDKTDRGLFSDIANSLPEFKSLMFDYNEFDSKNNMMTVAPLDAQAKKLEKTISKFEHQNPNVYLVCHSQGCVSAAIAKPKIKKAIFLAPPSKMDPERMIKYFQNRKGTTINLEDDSLIPRRDGSTTIIPKGFWPSMKVDLKKLYSDFAKQTELTIINASEDEVLRQTDFSYLKNKMVELKDDHNFTKNRKELIKTIRGLLT